jgi:1,5-anhydro-D-fructose reductase (1,5-anhydro-D-mannitol-forming)
VYVATPNELHHAVVLAAAGAGKHVLCEKPIALTVDQAAEMVEACESNSVILRVGFQLRFDMAIQFVVQRTRGGALGTPREMSIQRYAPIGEPGAWRREAGPGFGVLLDVGSHLIDLARLILGDNVTKVYATCYPELELGGPDDTALVMLDFDGGCRVVLRCSRELPVADNDIRIYGTKGALMTGPLRWQEESTVTIRALDAPEQEFRFPTTDLYEAEIDAFGAAIRGEPTPAATGREAVEVVRVAEAARLAMAAGVRVRS